MKPQDQDRRYNSLKKKTSLQKLNILNRWLRGVQPHIILKGAVCIKETQLKASYIKKISVINKLIFKLFGKNPNVDYYVYDNNVLCCCQRACT